MHVPVSVLRKSCLLALALAGTWLAASGAGAAEETMPSVSERYAADDAAEQPSFQRHVLPLMGRLGCNGRACHGSFQGRGGFRLSLFGYDFAADHKALLEGEEPRVNLEKPLASLILTKPTDENNHEGGERYKEGGWEYRVFRRWIESGAPDDGQKVGELVKLEVTPAEINFAGEKDSVQLKAIAHWSDGTREDVTPICRFQSNDDAVATVSEDGVVACTGKGDTHVVVFYDNGITTIPTMLPISPETARNYPKVPTPTKVDELVVAKLKKLGVVPSGLASDAEFLRRVSLDITGTLPAADEVEAFLASKSPNKRAEKIDELLDRPAYAAWWSTKFCDWTGNNAQFVGNNAYRNTESRQWYEWVQDRIARNVPYDEIVAGIVLATSREEGQSFEDYCADMARYYRSEDPVSFAEHHCMPHYWSRRNIRQPEEKALSFSYAFMGVQIQCAQCHKHPFDQWTQQDFEQFTAFFSDLRYGNRNEDREAVKKMQEDLGLAGKTGGDVRRSLPQLLDEGKVVPFTELFYAERRVARPNKNRKNRKPVGRVITPKVLGGEEVLTEEYADPREALMEWLEADDNPYFARALVNRVWANYFNVGIIDPPDDQNLANPPSNEPLLAWLTQEFIAHNYDVKWLHRTITNSRTYQLSWQANETNELDLRNFSHAVPRRLQAEVAYDALRMAVASDEERAKLQSEVASRAIGPGSGYNNRGNNSYALVAFGKPPRVETCDCERSVEPSLLQVLYMRNDSETLSMIERRGSWIDEVARANKLSLAPSAPPDNRNDRAALQIERQIRKIDQRIKQLRKEDKGKDQIEELRKDRDALERRLGKMRVSQDRVDQPSDGTDGKAVTKVDPKQVEEFGPKLIHQAYLRTLSRPPSDAELRRCLAHLEQSESLMAGLRDLMWALVNTKEFIVNH